MKKIYFLLIAVAFLTNTLFSQAPKSLEPGWIIHLLSLKGLTGQQSMTLPDGNILVTGGFSPNGAEASSFIYDYRTGTFQKAGEFNEARAYHSLVWVKLTDRIRIYVIGGYSGNLLNAASIASVEFADYFSGQNSIVWRNLGEMRVARGDCRSTWDKANGIIITGGYLQSAGPVRSGVITSSSELINIQGNQLLSLPDMPKQRAGAFIGTIINENGQNQVITAGGEALNATATEKLENGAWSAFAFAPKEYRRWMAGFADIGGIGRMFGGADFGGKSLNTCEWYDVKAGWKYSPSMFNARQSHSYLLVAGIKDTVPIYMIAGGSSNGSPINKCEYYTLPNSSIPAGSWTQFYDMKDNVSEASLAIDGNNLIYYIYGSSVNQGFSGNIGVFQPISANGASFGAEEVGRISDSMIVTLRNDWLLPVKINEFRSTNRAEFFFTGDTSNFDLLPGRSRSVFIRFRPNDIGIRTGYLTFKVGNILDSIGLAGAGIQSNIVVSTKSLDFGELLIGEDSVICFNAVKNIGSDTTYIDSISVEFPGQFSIVSPIGRTRLAPNQELEVCIRFKPNSKGTFTAAGVVNIGTRRFSTGLIGKGLLKYIKGGSIPGCDTIAYSPGNTYNGLITLINPSDRDVNVTGFKFLGGLENLYKINRNFPFKMIPGDRIDFLVEFSPTSEGTFSAKIQIEHDGIKDSIVIADLCFIARSRNLSFSESIINFGKVCSGDSVSKLLWIENPSLFESITIQQILANDPNGMLEVAPFQALTLQPRKKLLTPVTFKGKTNGVFSGEIIVSGSWGERRLNVNAEVLPQLSLNADISPIIENHLQKLSLRLGGDFVNTNINRIKLLFEYNSTVIKPLRIISSSGASQIDLSQSRFGAFRYNHSELELVWDNFLSGESIIELEFELLRGNSTKSEVAITALSDNICLVSEAFQIDAEANCGDRNGLINFSEELLFVTYPNPANESINFTFRHSNEIESRPNYDFENYQIEIFSLQGEKVLSRNIKADTRIINGNIDLSGLTTGSYLIRISDLFGRSVASIITIEK